MWAVFVSDPAGDKTGRKGCWTWTGHTGTKTDLFCDLEVGMLAYFLPRSGWTSSRWGGARITLVTASPLMTGCTISTVCRGFGQLLPTAPPLLPALSAHHQQKLFPAVTACPTTTPTTLRQTRDRPSGLSEDFEATGLRSTRAW